MIFICGYEFFSFKKQDFEKLIQPMSTTQPLHIPKNNPMSAVLRAGVMLPQNGDNWFKSYLSQLEMHWSAMQVPALAVEQRELAKSATAIQLQTLSSSELKYYHSSEFEENLGDLPVGSIVVIPVRGMMVREESWMTRWGYATSTKYLERIIKKCDANANIAAIVFDVNSGGGLGYGNQRLSKTIANIGTPTVLFYDVCASAALESFKSCDYIFANEDDSRIGSYGSYVSFIYLTEEGLKEYGYAQIEVYAPQSTEKNIEIREAKKGNTEPLAEMLRKSVEIMIADMKEQRPLLSDSWEMGRMFNTIEAMEIGLTDQMLSLDEVFDFLRTTLPEPQNSNFRASDMVNFNSK